MKITIGKPLSFSYQGQKDNQEDRICPQGDALSAETQCFVLCDGMGGHENGEVAAEIVSQNLYKYLVGNPPVNNQASQQWFNMGLRYAYEALDQMPSNQERRPGTTMTCVYLADNGLMCAHIGDSRIYVVSPTEGIKFQTSDHSLVNQLLKAGELTPEQAENFPRKNVITRAMQPGLGKNKYGADLSILTNLDAGDYVFMCCDGILEKLTNARLAQIVADTQTDASQKLDLIYQECKQGTRDNFTCILIPIIQVDDKPLEVTMVTPEIQTPPTAAPDNGGAPVAPSFNSTIYGKYFSNTGNYGSNKPQKGRSVKMIVIAVLVTIAVCCGVYFAFLRPDTEKEPEKTQQTQGKPDTDNGKTNGNPAKPTARTGNQPVTFAISEKNIDILKKIKKEFNALKPEIQENFLKLQGPVNPDDLKESGCKDFVDASFNLLKGQKIVATPNIPMLQAIVKLDYDKAEELKQIEALLPIVTPETKEANGVQ